jgi:hypothetical protein
MPVTLTNSDGITQSYADLEIGQGIASSMKRRSRSYDTNTINIQEESRGVSRGPTMSINS